MLHRKADPFIRDRRGNNALHVAAGTGSVWALDTLLDRFQGKKEKLNEPNELKQYPLDCIGGIHGGRPTHKEMAKRLSEAGCKFSPAYEGKSATQICRESGTEAWGASRRSRIASWSGASNWQPRQPSTIPWAQSYYGNDKVWSATGRSGR